MMSIQNPIQWIDLPDPDVIRVEDTYYMISTTMHLFPGGMILRSYDLAHWEIVTYLYDILEDSDRERLRNGQRAYGAGMWAATLRYHQGRFYVIFVANDIRDQNCSFLFTSDRIEGPWEKRKIKGFYHDCSLLFEGDRPFVAYGNGEIHLTELKKDLSGPLEGGFDQIVIRDQDDDMLRYEGTHFYRINGKYYMFFIHWPRYGTQRRVQSCFVADRIEGPYRGRRVLDDDMGYHNAGVAQGGLVETPDGRWYAMLFQDHGAVGRIPVLVPVTWDGEWPVFGNKGKVPLTQDVTSTRPEHPYAPLICSDHFNADDAKPGFCWQWNHIPDEGSWSLTDRRGWLRLKPLRKATNVVTAPNSIGQHTMGPACEATVLLDPTHMQDGDHAGLCVMQGDYAWIGVIKEGDKTYLCLTERSEEGKQDPSLPGKILFQQLVDGNPIRLIAACRFDDHKDLSFFGYEEQGERFMLPIRHQLRYDLEHFMGARFELFCYPTTEIGGYADFDDFTIRITEPKDFA